MDQAASDTALLQAIFDAAVDAIIVADHRGTIRRANHAACRLFKYDESELLGESVNLLMPEAIATRHDRYMTHHIETGERNIIGVGRDLEGLRSDGTIFPVHLSVGRTDVDGQPMFVGILHDLTHRKATQDALARSQRLDAIGQMTGGIAHDFNNLLTVVIGNLELLEDRELTSRQRPLVEDALSSAELGADLTSRLMVFARRSNLQPIAVDLRVLCDDTLALLRRTLGSSITIKTDFAAELDDVMIDPVQLQSTLVNLALNARDAMKAGGELLISIDNVSIDDTYIAQETDIEPGKYVRLSISDDGDGMSDETLKRAFEPFFTTKSERGGSGLGLAMVYGFVRQSGGHITVYSEPGLGTSFGLYFPAIAAEGSASDASAHSPDEVGSLLGQGKTVLVVEDNPKVRKLSVDRIRDMGFETEETDTGDEAYRLLKSGLEVDIVFSDLVMPGSMNGYDLAARIEEEFPDLKVLLTSGYASDVVTDSLKKGTEHEILHKPYRQSELAKRLQALLADEVDGVTV